MSSNNYDPVVMGLKWILILGRIIGVVPLSVPWKSNAFPSLRWCSFSAFHTLFLCFLTFLLTMSVILGGSLKYMNTYENILEQLKILEFPAFELTLVFVYLYFLKTAGTLVELLKKWSAVTNRLNFSTKDSNFPKFCLLITIVVMSVGITENILCDISMLEVKGKSVEGLPLFEKLYVLESREFSSWVPYHPGISWLFFYSMRVGTYAWNFGDIFLIVLCRALAFKFHQINMEIKQTLGVTPEGSEILRAVITESPEAENDMSETPAELENDSIKSKQGIQGQKKNMQAFQVQVLEMVDIDGAFDSKAFWKLIRGKILILCGLAEEITIFVGPLLVSCYCCNVFLIISRILQFLYDSRGVSGNLAYVYLSSLQFFIRTVLVTYHASQVYHSTETIVHTMEFSPDSSVNEISYRLERMLERHPVGVTIFGAVRITKKFFISIISFMFTTEIVLLQAMSAGNVRSVGVS